MSDIEAIAGHDGLAIASRTLSARATSMHVVQWRRLVVACALLSGEAVTALAVVTVAAAYAGALIRAPFALDPLVAAGSMALQASFALLLGLYEPGRASAIELLRLRVVSSLVFCAFVVAIPGRQIPALVQVSAWLLLVPTTVVVSSLMAGVVGAVLRRLELWQASAVLVGEAEATRQFSHAIAADPALGLRVVAEAAPDDLLLGKPQSLASRRADLAVLVSSGNRYEDARRMARLDFPSVVIAREIADMRTLWLNARTIGSVEGMEVRRRASAHDLMLKRAIDVLAGSFLLLCSVPIVAVLAAIVWCIDRQNPFYAQPRIGFGGRIVRVWKVRSMFADAETRLKHHLDANPVARAEWARSFKMRDDPRILPGIGRLIRRSSLDELPQLWNVVLGEMSLVGPRPFPAYHLSSFDQAFQQLRASVVPGLTGFWQITSRSDGDLAVQERADTFYVQNWSIWLDFYILLHTLPAVVLGKGAR